MNEQVKTFVANRSAARKVLLYEEKGLREKPIYEKDPKTLAIYFDEEFGVYCDIAETDRLFVPTYPRDFSCRIEARLTEENRMVDLFREAVEHDNNAQFILNKHLCDLDALVEAFKRLQVSGSPAASVLMNPISFTTFSKVMSEFIKRNTLKDKIVGGSFGRIWDAEIFLSQACSVKELFVVGDRFGAGVVVSRGNETGMALFDASAIIRIEASAAPA